MFCSSKIQIVVAKGLLDEPPSSLLVRNPSWAALLSLRQGNGLHLKKPERGVIVTSLLSMELNSQETSLHGCLQHLSPSGSVQARAYLLFVSAFIIVIITIIFFVC